MKTTKQDCQKRKGKHYHLHWEGSTCHKVRRQKTQLWNCKTWDLRIGSSSSRGLSRIGKQLPRIHLSRCRERAPIRSGWWGRRYLELLEKVKMNGRARPWSSHRRCHRSVLSQGWWIALPGWVESCQLAFMMLLAVFLPKRLDYMREKKMEGQKSEKQWKSLEKTMENCFYTKLRREDPLWKLW